MRMTRAWKRGSAGLLAAALAVTIATPAAAAPAAPEAVILERAKKITGENLTPPTEQRYVARNCASGGVPATSPLWSTVLAPYAGLPVQDCAPVRDGLKARALVLLPSAQQVATWIVEACRAIGHDGARLQACGTKLLSHMVGSNGLQFIVSGLIHEPKEFGFDSADRASPTCRATRSKEVLYSFRDGITVRLDGQPRISWRTSAATGCARIQPTDAELELFLSTNPVNVANFGRIAALTRAAYAGCANDPAVLPRGDAAADARWRSIVAAAMKKAFEGPRYELLEIAARALLKPSGGCSM
jgi:hypothetical protein